MTVFFLHSLKKSFLFLVIAFFMFPSEMSNFCHSFQSGIQHRLSGRTPFYQSLLLVKYNPNIYDDNSEEDFSTVEEGLRYFREYAKRGMKRFRERDIAGSLSDFNRAANANSSQPLIQRGIALYCAGHYQNASLQLERDIEILEGSQTFKASDLRIWLSASLNKLGRRTDAITALDHSYLSTSGLTEQRFIMNSTLSFYAGETSLDDMMSIIGGTDERDVFGFRFFGNFYLGLYYDSVGEADLARVFLSFPRDSTRYPERDMWFHVPRYLYTLRGWDDVEDVLL